MTTAPQPLQLVLLSFDAAPPEGLRDVFAASLRQELSALRPSLEQRAAVMGIGQRIKEEVSTLYGVPLPWLHTRQGRLREYVMNTEPGACEWDLAPERVLAQMRAHELEHGRKWSNLDILMAHAAERKRRTPMYWIRRFTVDVLNACDPARVLPPSRPPRLVVVRDWRLPAEADALFQLPSVTVRRLRVQSQLAFQRDAAAASEASAAQRIHMQLHHAEFDLVVDADRWNAVALLHRIADDSHDKDKPTAADARPQEAMRELAKWCALQLADSEAET